MPFPAMSHVSTDEMPDMACCCLSGGQILHVRGGNNRPSSFSLQCLSKQACPAWECQVCSLLTWPQHNTQMGKEGKGLLAGLGIVPVSSMYWSVVRSPCLPVQRQQLTITYRAGATTMPAGPHQATGLNIQQDGEAAGMVDNGKIAGQNFFTMPRSAVWGSPPLSIEAQLGHSMPPLM